MVIIPEIVKIAEMNDKVKHLAKKLEEKIDTDGLCFENAYFVDDCKEQGGHLYHGGCQLDNDGLVDDQYYCHQMAGYCEDDFHGTLYFKTKIPGKFVAVPFWV